MSRILSSLVLAVAATAAFVSSKPSDQATTPQPVDVAALKVGEYYRPQGVDVSGFPDAKTPFVRAPCPALNTLANHGYIPRNGKNITRDVLKQAVITVFNLDTALASLLTGGIPPVVSLAYLSTHNLFEHDVSFVHADSNYNQDPSAVDMKLWADLAARATNGRLGVKQISAAARDRITRCKAKPTGCSFSLKQRATMLGEAALVLLGFGAKNNSSVPVEHAQSFFVDERIPNDFQKAPTPVTGSEAAAMAAQIQAGALW